MDQTPVNIAAVPTTKSDSMQLLTNTMSTVSAVELAFNLITLPIAVLNLTVIARTAVRWTTLIIFRYLLLLNKK
jgi:hypothetical protein